LAQKPALLAFFLKKRAVITLFYQLNHSISVLAQLEQDFLDFNQNCASMPSFIAFAPLISVLIFPTSICTNVPNGTSVNWRICLPCIQINTRPPLHLPWQTACAAALPLATLTQVETKSAPTARLQAGTEAAPRQTFRASAAECTFPPTSFACGTPGSTAHTA